MIILIVAHLCHVVHFNSQTLLKSGKRVSILSNISCHVGRGLLPKYVSILYLGLESFLVKYKKFNNVGTTKNKL